MLFRSLRGKDIFDPSEVNYALVETNGTLSVSRMPQKDTPTRDDLKLPPPEARTPMVPLIIDGRVLADNLAWCGRNEQWLDKVLRQHKCARRQVLLLLGDDSGQVQLVKKESR